MTLTFQKATKTQSRLRMALDGPSGSGKTYTGLVFATALAKGVGNGRVAVIDTERGSAAKYADRFDFDVLALDTFAPKLYCEAIEAAEKAGYPVLLIDSLTHAWEGEGGVLDLHDQATRRQSSQNSFTAWKDVTPLHRRLVDTILTSSAHVIVTMRSKMEYVQSTENGRSVIKKVGMAPVQRQGIEYEFDIVGDLDTEHNMAITKSRCFAVTDAVVNRPTADWFKVIKDWLTEGVPMAAPEPRKPAPAPTPSDDRPTAQVADSRVVTPDAPKNDWIANDGQRKYFYAKVKELGIVTPTGSADADRVHAILNVERMGQYVGTMSGAIDKLEKAVKEPAQAEFDEQEKVPA